MNKSLVAKIALEILMWGITALVVVAVFYPIRQSMREWQFEAWNVGFIIGAVTLTRYVFLLPYTLIARVQWLKVALILAMFPVGFIIVNGINKFITYIEEHTWESITGHLPLEPRAQMEDYLWTEMLIFGVGSFVGAVALVIRLFISIWRQHNRDLI